MKLKLPPKLDPARTFTSLPHWLDLEYENKDPKVARSLKALNLALINLKRTKPPMASDFEMFTSETAYLIVRFKKMLNDSEMPDNIRDEVCEPFYTLLRKWQKGATKLQDILMEGEEETQDATDVIQEALPKAQLCRKNCAALEQRIANELKPLAQLAAFAKKDKKAPKLAAAVEKLAPEKVMKSMRTAQEDYESVRGKLLYSDTIKSSLDFAKKHNDSALVKAAAAYLAELAAIDKHAKSVETGMDKYSEIAVPLVEDVLGRKFKV